MKLLGPIIISLVSSVLSYDYGKVLELSLLFYEAQRSGYLPADNRIPWRGNSALNDSTPDGHDLTGGYYDAGDFVKFGFIMASTTTILSWGLLNYKDAYVASAKFGKQRSRGLASSASLTP